MTKLRRVLRKLSWQMLKMVGCGPKQLMDNRASLAIWEPCWLLRQIKYLGDHPGQDARITLEMKWAVHPIWDRLRETLDLKFYY